MIINIKIFLLIFLFTECIFADFEYKVDNTNITTLEDTNINNKDESYLYNYNRLRFRTDYNEDSYFASIIVDGVNYLGHNYINSNRFEYLKLVSSDTPFKTQSNFKDYRDGSIYTKIYRFYAGYEDRYNKLVIGLQAISMGVGRIWTPTNIFNPKNVYALEPDEVFGSTAISYTRYIDDTSHLTAVVSKKADHSFKYALRYKTFLNIADFAVNFVSSNNTKMLGYELEGNLADTGVELRSEGAYIKADMKTISGEFEKEFFQGIFGADYGFENGVSLACEVLYSTKEFSYEDVILNYKSEILSNMLNSKLYSGATLNYSFNIFLDASLLYIESFNDKNSRFVSPSMKYTLNDINSFSLGAMLQYGDSSSQFTNKDKRYYFKWSLSF